MEREQTPIDRLGYKGDLQVVIEKICASYNVGKPTDYFIIEVGYEDCNVVISTSNGKYVAKMFAKTRTENDIIRYSTVMRKVVDAGVNHPMLHRTSNDEVVYRDSESGISTVLMNFVAGKTFLQLKRSPDDQERRRVIEQAALVNTIEYHPTPLFDSWAIPNIHSMFERVRQFIHKEDLRLVEQVIALYDKIPVDTLPHCFVHGDFTKANVLKGDDGKIYILDFSVANWYPRIQELALIIANLLYDENDLLSLREKSDLVAGEYGAINPLTVEETKYLRSYALAGVAMEFMGAHQEKFLNGNDTQETAYWLELGRNGLRKDLLKKSSGK